MLIKRYYRQQRARLSVAPLALRPEVSRKRRLLRGGLLFFLAAVLLGGGGWMGWNHGGEVLQRSLDRQSRRIVQLEDQVASEMAARRLAEQQLTVERATRETLARELTRSQAQAVAQKEALAFFDSLLTANDRSRQIRVVACELQALGGQKFRYRALFAQGADNAAEFTGQLVVGVDYLQRGQRGRFVVGEDKPQSLRVRHYERTEGELTLPANAVPQALDIRVLAPEGRRVVAQCHRKTGEI